MPAFRIPRTIARRKSKPDLRRLVQHLAFVRWLPCVACGKVAPSEAAHVRTGTAGGVGGEAGRSLRRTSVHRLPRKPHRIGELTFWSALRIDPLTSGLAFLHHFWYMVQVKRLPAAFYQTSAGGQPVRDWLRGLSTEDRRAIGDDIRTVEFGWPIGMHLSAYGRRPL
jgi:hypothetical protein